MTGRALEAVLDQLHGLVAEALVTELRQHMELLEAPVPDGGEPYAIPPQFLDKVLKFLAQNGVTAPATTPRVDALAQRLADLDLDDVARPQH